MLTYTYQSSADQRVSMKGRINSIINSLWRHTDDVSCKILKNRTEKPFFKEIPAFEDTSISEAFRTDNLKWEHHEYIKLLKRRVIIEPDFSQCITGFNKILISSVRYEGPPPSFARYMLSFFKHKTKLPVAILFDADAGNNYFHFYSDMINAIWLLPMIEGYKDIPLIIRSETYDSGYFQYFLRNTDLKDLTWIVQKRGEFIEVGKLYLVKPMPYEGEYYKRLRSMPGIYRAGGERSRKIFLDRSQRSGRFIKNISEITPLLSKYGFEIVDTENKDLGDQIDLFQSTKYLISIHGAGNTNIIFADPSLRFLEIMPSNRLSCQYYWLSLSLGIDYYDVILGGDIPQTNVKSEMGIYVDPAKLEAAVRRMLDEKP